MSLQRFSQAAFFSSNSFFSSSVFSRLRPSLVTAISFLPSYSLSCWVAYSSMGSVMKSTSYPLLQLLDEGGGLHGGL